MGIARRSVMRVDADPGEGEFGHVGAPDDDRTRRFEPRYDRRVGRGRGRVVECFRPGERDFAGDVEQVLDRDREAGERRGDITGRAQPVLRLGRDARRVGIDLDKSAPSLAGRIGDARQRFLDQGAARRATRGKIGREHGQSGPWLRRKTGHRHPPPVVLNPREGGDLEAAANNLSDPCTPLRTAGPQLSPGASSCGPFRGSRG